MNSWTEDQTIVALDLYCNIPFNKATNSNPRIIETANILGRSVTSVKMKIGNFGSFDPELKKRGIVGLSNASKLDKEIWTRYSDNWGQLAYDSNRIISRLTGKPIESVAEIDLANIPDGAEREAIVRQRINQSFFRNVVLASYDYSCCITGLACADLLEACHITEWAADEGNRTNPRNGLCLNPLFHRAYDRDYIGITPDYIIKVSDRMFDFEKQQENIREFFMRFDNKRLILPNRFVPDRNLLDIRYQRYLKQ